MKIRPIIEVTLALVAVFACIYMWDITLGLAGCSVAFPSKDPVDS